MGRFADVRHCNIGRQQWSGRSYESHCGTFEPTVILGSLRPIPLAFHPAKKSPLRKLRNRYLPKFGVIDIAP